MVTEQGDRGRPHYVHPVRYRTGPWWWRRTKLLGYIVTDGRQVLCDKRTGAPWVFAHQVVARVVARNLAGDPLASDEARARQVHP